MVSIQYIFQIFKKKLNFLNIHVGRFCDNENLFSEKKYLWMSENKFFKNEKIWILKMLYDKHLLDF